MENKTTKTPIANACERYVVEELKQAKKELEIVKKQLETADKAYKNIVNVLVKGTHGFRLVKDESPDYDYLYFQNDFITTVWKDRSKENNQLRALIVLIETGELLPLI